jgi:alpha-tubulin suppressor-like RCC1 family protein
MLVDLKMHFVPMLIPTLANIVEIAAGNDFLIAVEDPSINPSGHSDVKLLGLFAEGVKVGSFDWFTTRSWHTLFNASVPPPTNPLHVFATPQCAFVLDSDGVPYAWGDNTHNKLGTRKRGSRNPPIKLRGFDKHRVTKIAGNHMMTLFLTDSGEVFVAGAITEAMPHAQSIKRYFPNALLDVFHSDESQGTFLKYPQKFHFDHSSFITDISVGGPKPGLPIEDEAPPSGHYAVVDKDGIMYTWGNNKEGQCGLGWSKRSLSVPYENKIKAAEGRPVSWVASGEGWTFFGVPCRGVGKGIGRHEEIEVDEKEKDGDGDVVMKD